MAAGAFLERSEQLKEIQGLFLINPGNRDYVLGKRQRLGSSTLLLPLLLLILVVILVACPLTAALSATSQQEFYWLLALVIIMPGGYGIVRAFRSYQRNARFDREGRLLQATITGVSTRERTPAAKTAVTLVQIFVLLMEIISMFSGSHTGSASTPDSDFYELTVQYTATTPGGTQISGTEKRNRTDLRAQPLPQPGDSILLLYIDDAHFKAM